MKPLCFVLMPFGTKTDSTGRVINFDEVYRSIIAPAVVAADLEPIRADEEKVGGTIHKPMFERLMLCDYAIADVTGANPNVYYELGIRHAIRPRSTVILFAEGTSLPFDIAPLYGIPYRLDASGAPAEPDRNAEAIAARLKQARRDPSDDSPLFQLIEGMPRIDVDHSKTDVFRERVDYSRVFKERLAEARRKGKDAVRAVASDRDLANLHEVEAGIIVDLFLTWRDVRGFEEMVELYSRMPPPLQRARMMREQLGFALGRLKKFDEAEQVLRRVIEEYGPSSETNGLLGRIYKDRWDMARDAGAAIEARGLLKRAIDTYAAGFEADWRDTYPGVNAVTLMEMQDKPDARQSELLPVVRYAALHRARTNGDYWDHATVLELEVLGRNPEAAEEAAAAAVAAVTAPWQLETTARNLSLIRTKRQQRGEDVAWIAAIEDELAQTQRRLEQPAQPRSG